MRLVSVVAGVAALALAAPVLAQAETCPEQYTHVAADTQIVPDGWGDLRAEVTMRYTKLDLEPDNGFDHTHGTFAVDPHWGSGGAESFIEGGVGILGHRRTIPWDRNGDGNPDPIVWASYEPPQPGIQLQFSFEGWAEPNTDYRFEIIRVDEGQDDTFRMWINGLESNLTWYGDLSHDPPQFGPGAKYVPGANRATVYGENFNWPAAPAPVCDVFDIQWKTAVPPMTRIPHTPDFPWKECFPSSQQPWSQGEFLLASSTSAYPFCISY
jgi:hypothetical protein